MSESSYSQLEASLPLGGGIVKFEQEGFSFIHPASWQVTHVHGFQYGVRDANGATALFRLTTVSALDTQEEGILAAALNDVLEELPDVVQGDKFATGFYTGLTSQLEVVWKGVSYLFWAVVIGQTSAAQQTLKWGVLIIAVPATKVDVGERDARLILDSFAVGGQSVTDMRISMGRIESVTFEPSTLIETKRLPADPDVKTLEGLPTQPSSASLVLPKWQVSVSTLTASEGGYADGLLVVAKFLRPNGITCDPEGNLYIADFGNHRIRQISVDGLVQTLAGSGQAGNRDDLGLLAEFNGPRGIAYAAGYLYVADLNNASVRRLTLDGAVTTLAGDGTEGTRDGIGKQARFKSPRAIAVDASGTVYVADEARVRCIYPDGMVVTLAGSAPGCLDGPAEAARFDTLSGLALDRLGNLYLADAGNRRLRKLSRDGQVSTLPVGPDDKIEVPILHPVALSVGPDGTLYVLDVADFSLKAVLPEGQVIRIIGGQQGMADGDATTAHLWMPTALTFLDHRLYITDRERHAIRLVRFQNIEETSLFEMASAGSSSAAVSQPVPEDQKLTKPSRAVPPPIPAQMASPASGLASGSRSVPPFSRQSGLGTTDIAELLVTVAVGDGLPGFLDGVGTAAQLNHPVGLALDAQGVLYIADHFNHAIRKLLPDGRLVTLAGGERGFRDGRGKEAQFNGPLGLAVGRDGELYVADHLNARVRKVTPDGDVSTLAGTGISKIEDGPIATASFEGPKGIAVDPHGVVYVTDGVTVRTITPDGRVHTLAGQIRGFRDGIGTHAMFGWSYAAAVDVSGLCFVTDAANHAIRCVFPDGTVKTVFGGGEARQLNFPNGLAVDVFGHLYVADTNNHRILRLTPNGNGYLSSLVCGVRRGRQTGSAQEAELDSPRGIIVGFQNNLYIADSNANRILCVGSAQAVPAVGVPPVSVLVSAPVVSPTSSLELKDVETVSGALPHPASLHASNSLPTEVTDLAEQMERRKKDTPSDQGNLSGQVAALPAPALVQPVVSPGLLPAVRPRHIAATVLGWGIELSGNNLIRTEPDGSLLLDTSYNVENSAFFYLPWEVTSDQKVIIDVRMQLVAYVGERDATGCAIWFETDHHADALLIQPDGIRLLRVPELAYACNPAAGIHTYSIMLHGSDVRIGVNGVICIHGEGRFWKRLAAQAGRALRRWLAFGDASSMAGSISRWQSLTYQIVSPETDTLPL
ncbi:MAG: NHL repeat-containing protein [Acidobacteriota bacterium]